MRILPTPIGLSRSATYDGQRCLMRHYPESLLSAAPGGNTEDGIDKPTNTSTGDAVGQNKHTEKILVGAAAEFQIGARGKQAEGNNTGETDAEKALAEIIKNQKGRGAVIELGTGQGGTKPPETPKGVNTTPNVPPKFSLPDPVAAQIKFSE